MIKTTLKIDGMACGMCESHINDAVRKKFAVKKVNSSHSKGLTEILSENSLDEEKLMQTIGETGYAVLSVKTEEYVKKGLLSTLGLLLSKGRIRMIIKTVVIVVFPVFAIVAVIVAILIFIV